jgi:hypothetical protein
MRCGRLSDTATPRVPDRPRGRPRRAGHRRGIPDPAAELASGSEPAAARLASAIAATAHGHAVLMLDGTFGSGPHAAEAAADQAAAATLALISGRDYLTPRHLTVSHAPDKPGHPSYCEP